MLHNSVANILTLPSHSLAISFSCTSPSFISFYLHFTLYYPAPFFKTLFLINLFINPCMIFLFFCFHIIITAIFFSNLKIKNGMPDKFNGFNAQLPSIYYIEVKYHPGQCSVQKFLFSSFQIILFYLLGPNYQFYLINHIRIYICKIHYTLPCIT